MSIDVAENMEDMMRVCGSSDDEALGLVGSSDDEGGGEEGAFEAAAAAARDKLPRDLDQAVRLELYGLYKLGTVGPCAAPRPGFMDLAGRAKWDAWMEAGARGVDRASARVAYVELVRRLVGDPAAGGSAAGGGAEGRRPSGYGIGGGAVGSMMAREEGEDGGDTDGDGDGDGGQGWGAMPLLVRASRGDLDGVLHLVAQGGVEGDVAAADPSGMTALHVAVDREHADVARALIEQCGADPAIQDADGNTPLHLAALVESVACAAVLVRASMSAHAPLNHDGETPRDLFPASWTALPGAASGDIGDADLEAVRAAAHAAVP